MVTGFEVSPGALDAYARLIARGGSGSVASLYLNQAESYRAQYVKLPADAGGEIFHQIVDETRQISDALRVAHLKVNDVLVAGADNLAASADTYRTTDHGVAQRLDAKYQPFGVVVPPYSNLLEGDAPADPAAVLRPPAGGDDDSNLAEEILSYIGIASVGGVVMKVLDVFDLHPEDWVTERFFGNADEVARTGHALAQVARFDVACGKVLAQGLETMTGQWTGHAASAAMDWFATVPDGLQDRSNTLNRLAELYDQFHTFLKWAADEIGDLMGDAIDKAVQVASALGAAGCLGSIPVVNVIIGIVGATTAYRLYRAIQAVYEFWDKVHTLLETNLAAFSLIRVEIASWSAGALHLPRGTYHNGSQTTVALTPTTVPRNVR